MKFTKIAILALFTTLTICSFTACSNKKNTSNSTFPGIDNDDIPDVLEITVGTIGYTYFSSGITDNPDYKSILIVTFKDITEADYITLLEHYQSDSTETTENGTLLFDWGQLQITFDTTSITINAYIM